ncbi:uncharacterized protein JCM6883_001219 [Sporobolomyces salmoneus]|uniref:uncharacterized protein n=1 Tax=Sporobolomyces salmoneus TaxID=183962 RepID=UPI003176D80B
MLDHRSTSYPYTRNFRKKFVLVIGHITSQFHPFSPLSITQHSLPRHLPIVATSDHDSSPSATALFQLSTLLDPIDPTSSSLSSPSPSTPRPLSPPNARSVLNSLVSSVVDSTTSTGSPARRGGAGKGTRGSVVKGIETTRDRVYVASSRENLVKVYSSANVEEGDEQGEERDLMDLSDSPPTRSPSSRVLKKVSALKLVETIQLSPILSSKKLLDRFEFLPEPFENMAIILSDGILTFHSLPHLTPLNVHQFPSVRGVVSFSIDHSPSSSSSSSLSLIVIKRRTIHHFQLLPSGLESLKELPLPPDSQTIQLVVLKGKKLCLADQENYLIIDLERAEALPLLPISQAPNSPPDSPDPESPSPSPSSSNSKHRPLITSIGSSEFLLASHTSTSTLGVFINSFGEPCRGTLEWSSTLLSFVALPSPSEGKGTRELGVGLLEGGIVEVHDLNTQELVQRLEVGRSVRSLKGISVRGGLEVRIGELEGVKVPLRRGGGAPSTPPPRQRKQGGNGGGMRTKTRTQVLVVGDNQLWGLTERNWVLDAEELIGKGMVGECLELVRRYEENSSSSSPTPELNYIYLLLAYTSLTELNFKDSFLHFLSSNCDPRIVISLFTGLSIHGIDDLISVDDLVEVPKGVKREIESGKTIDSYIMDNLNHNYSPHLLPSVALAPSTLELRQKLVESAKEELTSFLMKWRIQRREGGSGSQAGRSERNGRRSNDSRKTDIVVDTSLVSLLASAATRPRLEDIRILLASPNDVVVSAIEPSLEENGLWGLVAELAGRKGRWERVLEVWTKIVEGEYKDDSSENGTRQIFDLLWTLKDRKLVEEYGIWLLRYDRELGLKLFNDPKQTMTFETRRLYEKMKEVDQDAADTFLEGAVLQERDTDSTLHADLVKRYLGILTELLGDAEAKAHLREQETSFLQLDSSIPTTFLSHLTSLYSPSSRFAKLDRIRLKTILFLSTSSKYDLSETKNALEEMEMKGLKGLTLERVIVYGKLKLDRPALSLLLHTLHDLPSSETYSLQSGDPLSSFEISQLVSLLQIPLKRVHKRHQKREEGTRRKETLARILVEMCLSSSSTTGGEGNVKGEAQIARILETQAINLDTVSVLPSIPDQFPLDLLASFLSRSIRRSLHEQQEASILKNLASRQNLGVSEKLFKVQERFGPTIERGSGRKGEKGMEGEKLGEGEKGDREVEREKEIVVVNPPPSGMSLEDAVEPDLR